MSHEPSRQSAMSHRVSSASTCSNGKTLAERRPKSGRQSTQRATTERADTGRSQTHLRAVTPGEDLHTRIGAERWCITRADLSRLRRDVRTAVAQGKIRSTTNDPFDPEDTKVGPNIYTVVDQLIKPMTDVDGPSGGASYALTHHPDGIDCEIFITHAWCEGVYEFIDKVLASWPWGKRSAYACMLSNPQNGDFLASMISDPSSSPFARALSHATHVIAVPNQTVGIYTRLWCCYEAYLAYVWDKEIFTAWTPVGTKRGLKTVGGPFLVTVVTAALGMVCVTDGMLRSDLIGKVIWWGTMPALTISLVHASLSAPGLRRTVSIYMSSVLVAFNGCVTVRRQWIPNFSVEGTLSSTALVTTVGFIWVSVVPILLAIDGVRGTLRKADLVRLGLGFSGTVRESTCTLEDDRENIFGCIGDEATSVDQSIRVLLQSGMSTASMRKAASLGIAVERLCFIQWGPAYLLWSTWIILCLGLYRPGLFQVESAADIVSWQTAQCFYPVMHLIVYAASARDHKSFIVYVTYKLLIWLVALDMLVNTLGLAAMYQPIAIAYNVFGMLSLIISAMGLGGLVSIPLVGQHCARWLVGKVPLVEDIHGDAVTV